MTDRLVHRDFATGIPAAEELPTGGGNGVVEYFYDTAATI
jgi:hypothetical protein